MLRHSLSLGFCAFVVACGGEAIIDPPLGTGGAGGRASSSTSSTSTTNVTNVAVSSATGMVDDICDQACATVTECGGDPDDCEIRCEAANQNPQCGDLHDDFLACALGEINSLCGSVPGQACSTVLNEWLSCTGLLVMEDCALGPMGECNCSAFVSPGVTYGQQCTPGGGCECTIGGSVIGVCSPNDEVCGIANGCCAGLFWSAPF